MNGVDEIRVEYSPWPLSLGARIYIIRHVRATAGIQRIVKEDPRTRNEPSARPTIGLVAFQFALADGPIDVPLVRRRGLRSHAVVPGPIEVTRAAGGLGFVPVV